MNEVKYMLVLRNLASLSLAAPVFSLLALLSGSASAQNIANGQALFNSIPGSTFSCATSRCHSGFPDTKINKIARGANDPALILSAISNGTGGMSVLSGLVSATQAADIAAYIGNPTGATAAAPAISVSLTTLSFGAVLPNVTSAIQTVTVSNTGTATLTLSGITLAGTNSSEFNRAGTCATNAPVAAGGSCTITAAFRPTSVGAKTASIAIAHNATGSPSTISLTGTGASAPTLVLSATTLTLPNAAVGASSTASLTVTNGGTAALSFTSLVTGGTDAADFVYSGTCAAATAVAVNGTCTIAYTFTPAAATARSATLTIVSNNNGGTVTVPLSGTGVANTPVASITPTTLAFGSVQVGTTSAAQTVTVRNTGGGTLAVSGISSGNAAVFPATGCSGANLTANQSCAISVTFNPSSAAAATAALAITHSASASAATVALSGTGSALPIPVVSATPATVAFAATAVGQQSAASRITLTNAGPGTVTLGAISVSSGFVNASNTAAGACGANAAVMAAASCWIDVAFAPMTAGANSGTLSIASNGQPAALSVPLSGTSTAMAVASAQLSPAAVDFGSVTVGRVSAPLAVVLTNTGNAALTVSSLSLGSGPFSWSTGVGACSTAAFTLQPTETCTAYVKLTPTSAGNVTGQMQVMNGATLQAQASLTGTGDTAPPASTPSPPTANSQTQPTNVGAGAVHLPLTLLLLLVGLAQWRRSVRRMPV